MGKMTVRMSNTTPMTLAFRNAGLCARMVPAVLVAAGSFSTATAQVNQGVATGESQVAASGAKAGETSLAVLAEVIVTAQKREERTIDIPMSISALSAETLAVAGVDNALDLSLVAPGLAALEFGPGMQMLSIRGISSERGSSALIGVYLDEMPVTAMQATANTPDLRMLDIERVEVLKGPQGTLFGEGAAGGVVRFITRDPDLARLGGELATEFSTTADGGWSKEVTGIVNIPIATDRFGVRIAAKYEDNAGWIDQPTADREDINDSEVKHVRVKALLQATDKLQMKALAEIHRNDVGAQNVVNDFPAEQSNFIQAYDRFAPTDYFSDYELFNLTVTYDLGFAQLLSSTSRAEFDSSVALTQLTRERPDPYLEILPRGTQTYDTSITAQELRLVASEGALKWVAGLNYKDADSTGFSGEGLDVVLFGGTADELLIPGLGFGATTTNTSKSWAGFADVSYDLTDRMQVGAGLRYFYDERETFDPRDPASYVTGDFDQVTYRGYIRYEIATDVNAYASVGTGFRSGGFNGPANIARGASPSYGPEETIFYELGAKASLLGDRLRLDGALFYGDYQGMLEDVNIASPVDGGILQYTSNSQDAEIRGVELTMDWLATDQLTLSVSGTVTDTEITWVAPAVTNPTFLVGDPINSVPDYGLSARADYRFEWAGSMPGFWNVTFNRKGRAYDTNRNRYGGITLDDQAVSTDVNFLNAKLGLAWNGWDCSLFGQNLLDEERPVNAGVTGILVQYRPRTIGIGIGKSF